MATKAEELSKKGWHLNSHGKSIVDQAEQDGEDAEEVLLNSDLGEVGERCLPNKLKEDAQQGDMVLQVHFSRAALEPSRRGEKKGPLVVTLTDGHREAKALEYPSIVKGLPRDMPPGCKVRLQGQKRKEGVFLLSEGTVAFLGGRVESLESTWKLEKEAFARHSSQSWSEGAPQFKPYPGDGKGISKPTSFGNHPPKVERSAEVESNKKKVGKENEPADKESSRPPVERGAPEEVDSKLKSKLDDQRQSWKHDKHNKTRGNVKKGKNQILATEEEGMTMGEYEGGPPDPEPEPANAIEDAAQDLKAALFSFSGDSSAGQQSPRGGRPGGRKKRGGRPPSGRRG